MRSKCQQRPSEAAVPQNVVRGHFPEAHFTTVDYARLLLLTFSRAFAPELPVIPTLLGGVGFARSFRADSDHQPHVSPARAAIFCVRYSFQERVFASHYLEANLL